MVELRRRFRAREAAATGLRRCSRWPRDRGSTSPRSSRQRDAQALTRLRATPPGHTWTWTRPRHTIPITAADLALIHHLGFGFHADACAPAIIDLLTSVRECDGLVVEIGCGSGLLTRHLVEAGHRVIATDASTAMLDLARRYAPGADFRRPCASPMSRSPGPMPSCRWAMS